MENKINIAELLKYCPKGMELDCAMYDNLVFCEIDSEAQDYPIITQLPNGVQKWFTSDGRYELNPNAKCIIFPKGKTTWEGFQGPFVDGDIVALDSTGGSQVFIFEEYIRGEKDYAHCYLMLDDDGAVDLERGKYYVGRFATEEEKQKLFDAIKANGYKWNEETKTLGKLEDKGNISDGYHTFNELYEYRLLYNASMFNELAKQGLYDVHKSKKHSDGTAPFGDGNWFIVQAELPTGQISNHYEMKDWELFNVPEKEKANPYDGHTPQNVAKRLRDFLTLDKLIEPKFKVGDKVRHKNNHGVVFTITSIAEDSYVCGTKAAFWFDDQDDYELVSDKFGNPLLGALATFGAEHQRMMCIEECAELIDALAKYDRGRADTKDVITELADVCIMVEQMAMLFGKGEFEKEKERKLKRLQKKIDEASNL